MRKSGIPNCARGSFPQLIDSRKGDKVVGWIVWVSCCGLEGDCFEPFYGLLFGVEESLWKVGENSSYQ